MIRPYARRCIAAALLLFFAATDASACTLWAAAGSSVAGGGTLLVKNRDWQDQAQIAETITPPVGYRYFGVFALNPPKKSAKTNRRLVAGINEAGLVAVSATAGSIPRKLRLAGGFNVHLLEQLLTGSKSVDEALRATNLASAMFTGPRFLLLADAHTVAWAEIGPGGKTVVHKKNDGVLAHTNHYLAPATRTFNTKIGESSKKRLERIRSLLREAQKPHTLEQFLTFAGDTRDGPDNSIFRAGSAPGKARTLAVFAVSIPPEGRPEIRLWMKGSGTDAFTAPRFTDLFPPRP